jgi:hypothetical protein
MPTPATTRSGPTTAAPRIAIARIGPVSGRNEQVADNAWVDVHFNPASLQLQVSNELKDTRNNERKQYVAKANAKLTMELQFDTSDTGADVTETTHKLQLFIAPPLNQQNNQQIPPPVIVFEWGRLRFKGIAESYKETLDFFSANGVPLRASVNLTLSRQDQVFDEPPGEAPQNAGTTGGDDDLFDAPPASAADVSNSAESPDAARSVAEANAQESMRFGDGSPLTVSSSVNLKPPAGFASAGGGLGISLGGGLSIGGAAGVGGGIGGAIGVGGGIGIGIGGGIGVGGAAGIGALSAGISGGGVSAGISGLASLSATEGAFAGLRVSPRAGASTARLNTSKLVPQVGSATLATDRHARFDVGGKATLEGAAGLSAEVGGGIGSRLSFESS